MYDYLTTVSKAIEIDKRTIRRSIDDYGVWMGKGVMVIPAARALVGSTFRAWVVGNSSSTGTLIFKVRCGAGGTITDTIDWTAVTSAAQVANQRAGFEVLITIRSPTTIAVDGVGYAGAVQLPTTIAIPATPAITISGTWYINMTVVCSSGAFTAQVGSIEEIR